MLAKLDESIQLGSLYPNLLSKAMLLKSLSACIRGRNRRLSLGEFLSRELQFAVGRWISSWLRGA
jgi:hypothetical protein